MIYTCSLPRAQTHKHGERERERKQYLLLYANKDQIYYTTSSKNSLKTKLEIYYHNILSAHNFMDVKLCLCCAVLCW